jgi:hypothetical protein
VEFHLEHGLRLHAETEYKSLYQWAISEVDAKGKKIRRDQIPWEWSLYFTATSCSLRENLELKAADATRSPPKPPTIDQRRSITAKLKPGQRGHDGKFWREASFSMFGTSRTIEDFSLTIYPLVDAAEPDRCEAWGSVSYTAEMDFRHETTPDCIIFRLFVKQETFDRYAAKIAFRSMDEIILHVKGVSGFYSDWSPEVSTDHVKVLVGSDEQTVALPEGVKFSPPRLGEIEEATLYINRRLEFDKHEDESETLNPGAVDTLAAPASSPAPKAAIDANVFRAVRSLKRAAWCIAALLVLILLSLASRH